jgi:hypothetical protein
VYISCGHRICCSSQCLDSALSCKLRATQLQVSNGHEVGGRYLGVQVDGTYYPPQRWAVGNHLNSTRANNQCHNEDACPGVPQSWCPPQHPTACGPKLRFLIEQTYTAPSHQRPATPNGNKTRAHTSATVGSNPWTRTQGRCTRRTAATLTLAPRDIISATIEGQPSTAAMYTAVQDSNCGSPDEEEETRQQ